MTPLKSDEIRKMEIAGQCAGKTLAHVVSYAKEGATTNELDQIAYDYIMSQDAIPAPLNYRGFPKSICTSVNECVCHGVPDDKPLKKGDVINIDVTCIKSGFHGDTSTTVFIGDKPTESQKSLVDCAFNAMWKGIQCIGPEATTGDIGFSINKLVTRKGFYAVRDIGGHGIGQKFHTDPFVPSHGKKGHGYSLKTWACLTVEPMINENSEGVLEFSIANSEIKYYETTDKSLSAQFEHTVLVTDKGYEVLTLI